MTGRIAFQQRQRIFHQNAYIGIIYSTENQVAENFEIKVVFVTVFLSHSTPRGLKNSLSTMVSPSTALSPASSRPEEASLSTSATS